MNKQNDIKIVERNVIIGYMGIRHIQTGLIQNLEVGRLWLKKDEEIQEGQPNPDPIEVETKAERLLVETAANFARIERRLYKETIKGEEEVKS
jgi:hypothetical protein